MNRLLESGLNPLRGPCAALAAKYMVLPIRSVDKRDAGGGRREAGGGRRECRKVPGASLATHLSSLALPSSPDPASRIPHPYASIQLPPRTLGQSADRHLHSDSRRDRGSASLFVQPLSNSSVGLHIA